jgi:hypothetical protein
MAAWKKTHAVHPQNAALARVPFSPNARLLAFGSLNNRLKLWDVANSQKTQFPSQKRFE